MHKYLPMSLFLDIFIYIYRLHLAVKQEGSVSNWVNLHSETCTGYFVVRFLDLLVQSHQKYLGCCEH